MYGVHRNLNHLRIIMRYMYYDRGEEWGSSSTSSKPGKRNPLMNCPAAIFGLFVSVGCWRLPHVPFRMHAMIDGDIADRRSPPWRNSCFERPFVRSPACLLFLLFLLFSVFVLGTAQKFRTIEVEHSLSPLLVPPPLVFSGLDLSGT